MQTYKLARQAAIVKGTWCAHARYNRVMEGGSLSLPPHIKTSDKSVENFKKELFNYFFNKYNDIDSFSIS